MLMQSLKLVFCLQWMDIMTLRLARIPWVLQIAMKHAKYVVFDFLKPQLFIFRENHLQGFLFTYIFFILFMILCCQGHQSQGLQKRAEKGRLCLPYFTRILWILWRWSVGYFVRKLSLPGHNMCLRWPSQQGPNFWGGYHSTFFLRKYFRLWLWDSQCSKSAWNSLKNLC